MHDIIKNEQMEWTDFLYAGINPEKLKCWSNYFWVGMVKNGLSVYETQKSSVSSEWIYELSWYFNCWQSHNTSVRLVSFSLILNGGVHCSCTFSIDSAFCICRSYTDFHPSEPWQMAEGLWVYCPSTVFQKPLTL